MICELCKQDRPSHHMAHLAYVRPGWPPIAFRPACRRCRQQTPGALWRRALAVACCVALFGLAAAASYGVVHLVLWIVRRASTS